jgi:hypothetical protein
MSVPIHEISEQVTPGLLLKEGIANSWYLVLGHDKKYKLIHMLGFSDGEQLILSHELLNIVLKTQTFRISCG